MTYMFSPPVGNFCNEFVIVDHGLFTMSLQIPIFDPLLQLEHLFTMDYSLWCTDPYKIVLACLGYDIC